MSVSVRTRVAVVAAATAAAFAVAGSQAAGADMVTLRVSAPSIDGQVTFVSSTGWSSACAPASSCTIRTPRGSTFTFTAASGGASPFDFWGGACAPSGLHATCTIQANADLDITAWFTRLRLWLPSFGPGSIEWRSGGVAPVVGRSCGNACVDLPNGSRIVLHARAADGYRLTAWGGDCTGVRSTSDCVLTLGVNGTVAATFERIPPPSDCGPNQSCDPVEPSIPYTVVVTGTGTVTAPRMKSIQQVTCRSYTSTGSSCRVDRPVQKTLQFVATGVRFLGWDGACSGQRSTVCTIYSRNGGGNPSVIARFG